MCVCVPSYTLLNVIASSVFLIRVGLKVISMRLPRMREIARARLWSISIPDRSPPLKDKPCLVVQELTTCVSEIITEISNDVLVSFACRN